MKKKDILFESDMLSLLKPLFEQDPGTAIPAGQPTQAATPATPATPQQTVPQQATPTAPQQGQEVVSTQTSEIDTEIKFQSTKDMFTSAPPPNSSDWPAEIKEKPWMIPLQDGRVAQKLMKMFPTFKDDKRGHGAARYNDNQFRVIIRGDLAANAELRALASTRNPGQTMVELVSIDIPINKASNLSPTGTNKDSMSQMRNKGSLKIKMPTEALVKWATGKSTQEQVEKSMERVEDLMDQLYDQASNDTKDRFDRGDSRIKSIETTLKDSIKKGDIENLDDSTIMKELFKKFKRVTGDQEVEEPDTAKKSIKVEDHPSYNIFMEIATGKSMDMTNNEARSFINWIIKNKKPPLKKLKVEDATKILLQNIESYKRRNDQQESLDIHSYLKSLLLEAGKHGKGELEAKKGGQLISEINDQLFKEWFAKKGAGIAAPTNSRLFEGNMYEWFAVSSATFRPKERSVEGKGDDAVISFKGKIAMQVEMWFDARVGEGKAGFSSWSFRVWDHTSPISKTSFKIPVLLKKAIKDTAKGASNLVKTASNAVTPQKTQGGISQL